MAGDSAARALLQKLTHAASAPYFGILDRYLTSMYDGHKHLKIVRMLKSSSLIDIFNLGH